MCWNFPNGYRYLQLPFCLVSCATHVLYATPGIGSWPAYRACQDLNRHLLGRQISLPQIILCTRTMMMLYWIGVSWYWYFMVRWVFTVFLSDYGWCCISTSYIAYIDSCPDGYIIQAVWYNPILTQLGLHSILLPDSGYAIVYAHAKASDRNTKMDIYK